MGKIYRPISSFASATLTIILGFLVITKTSNRIDLAIASLIPLLIAVVVEASRIGKDDEQIGREDGFWWLARGSVLLLFGGIFLVEFATPFVLSLFFERKEVISWGDLIIPLGIFIGVFCQALFGHNIHTILEVKPPRPTVISPGKRFS